MKELCFKEAKELGLQPSYCRGNSCENYPCEARVESDKQTKFPACYGDSRCTPCLCKHWYECTTKDLFTFNDGEVDKGFYERLN